MKSMFPLGTVVHLRGLGTERYAYLGYNARTDRHEVAMVGKKTDAIIDDITVVAMNTKG